LFCIWLRHYGVTLPSATDGTHGQLGESRKSAAIFSFLLVSLARRAADALLVNQVIAVRQDGLSSSTPLLSWGRQILRHALENAHNRITNEEITVDVYDSSFET
jgi:hypothetical protein